MKPVMAAVVFLLALPGCRMPDDLFKPGDMPPPQKTPPEIASRESSVVERFGQSYPPRSADHPIEVYYVRLPDREFDEVGIVRAEVDARGHQELARPALIDELKGAARSLGGDGIAALDESSITEVVGGEWAVGREIPAMSAVVIRFR